MEVFPNMLVLKGRESRRDAIRTVAAVVDNKLCRRVKQRDSKLFADIREINSKMDKLIIIRDSVITVLKTANKPDMKITPGQMHW